MGDLMREFIIVECIDCGEPFNFDVHDCPPSIEDWVCIDCTDGVLELTDFDHDSMWSNFDSGIYGACIISHH